MKESPAGFLPVLTTPCGAKIIQTTAIIRYVAAELNLMGENNVERGLIDGIIVSNKELHDAAVLITYVCTDEEKVGCRLFIYVLIMKTF